MMRPTIITAKDNGTELRSSRRSTKNSPRTMPAASNARSPEELSRSTTYAISRSNDPYRRNEARPPTPIPPRSGLGGQKVSEPGRPETHFGCVLELRLHFVPGSVLFAPRFDRCDESFDTGRVELNACFVAELLEGDLLR